MQLWIDRIWEYIRVDYEMDGLITDIITGEMMFKVIGEKDLNTVMDAKKLHKAQYRAAKKKGRMDRLDGYNYQRILDIIE